MKKAFTVSLLLGALIFLQGCSSMTDLNQCSSADQQADAAHPSQRDSKADNYCSTRPHLEDFRI